MAGVGWRGSGPTSGARGVPSGRPVFSDGGCGGGRRLQAGDGMEMGDGGGARPASLALAGPRRRRAPAPDPALSLPFYFTPCTLRDVVT
jgi:hypothetical protein